MASQYVTEPPTTGKLLLRTSKGEIEVELWAKEAPRACRNVVALALEGYYDDCLFHRVVPGFCVQTGDPTGTGTGGESFYGAPFETEPHSRLRFNRRGLVAMATAEPGQNESQFFITLDATPQLQGKYTIFGRVVGPTIYNVLSISEVELSPTEPDRPVYPPKLNRVDVLENPFDDIVPRITRQEKRQQAKAKRDAAQRRAKNQQQAKGKKNTALLSFGEAEEADPSDRIAGPKSSHDLLVGDKRLSRQLATATATAIAPAASSSSSSSTHPDKPAPTSKEKERSADTDAHVDLASLRASHQANTTTDQRIRDLESSIRRDAEAEPKSQSKSKSKDKAKTSLLASLRAQYQKPRPKHAPAAEAEAINDSDAEPEYGSDNDDLDWRSKPLDAGGVPLQRAKDRDDEYQVLDPRDSNHAPAGKRGRDWVESRDRDRDRDSRRHKHRR